MNTIKTTGKARIQFLMAGVALLGMEQNVSAELIMSENFGTVGTTFGGSVVYINNGTSNSGGLRRGSATNAATTIAIASTTPGWDANIAVITTTPNIGDTITLFADPLDSTNQTVRRDSFQTNSGRIDRLFDGAGGTSSTPTSTQQVTPTAAVPLSAMWRFYDGGGLGTPLPLGVFSLGGGTASGITVGFIPTLDGNTGTPSDPTKYQASGAGNNPAFNLATSRLASPGWVTFELLLTDTTGSLFVNGSPTADANFNNLTLAAAGGSYGRIRLGQINGNTTAAPISTTGSIPFVLWDDININTVPEPSSLLLCAVASVSGLVRQVRRRK